MTIVEVRSIFSSFCGSMLNPLMLLYLALNYAAVRLIHRMEMFCVLRQKLTGCFLISGVFLFSEEHTLVAAACCVCVCVVDLCVSRAPKMDNSSLKLLFCGCGVLAYVKGSYIT